MDFITYLADNDHIVFAALCHVFSPQIEKAMGKLRDNDAWFSTSSPDAPRTQLRIYIPHKRKAEIEFIVTVGGRRFDLCGLVEIEGDSSDRPTLSLRGHDYYYHVEHSRLIYHKSNTINKKEAKAFADWWAHVQQSEIISRLQVV